ncbi:hypothetical protein COLO4_28578 [Corchorus olitorius]|uniref:Uncharacterized protein n=1 Tax=Corchorus olitorius TaxID=93759 RepID=A0A1R3HJX2_9ROSI|nr:hypothetical protein COLO4_28578 [Corchorus olitorius]
MCSILLAMDWDEESDAEVACTGDDAELATERCQGSLLSGLNGKAFQSTIVSTQIAQ